MADENKRRWGTATQVRFVLLISLGLNLFLAGYVAASRSARPFGSGPAHVHALLDRMRTRLSPESMSKVESIVAAIENTRRSKKREGEGIHIQLQRLLTDNEFDSQRFMALVAQANAARSKSDEDIARQIAVMLAQMPLADRKILADVLFAHGPP